MEIILIGKIWVYIVLVVGVRGGNIYYLLEDEFMERGGLVMGGSDFFCFFGLDIWFIGGGWGLVGFCK